VHDGKPVVNNDDFEQLNELFDCSLPTTADQTDDALYATTSPHRVGDTWAMRTDLLAAAFGPSANVTSNQVKFAGIEKIDGHDCYMLNMTFGATTVVDGAEITHEGSSSFALPVDATLPVLRGEWTARSSRGDVATTRSATFKRTIQ
jgi:hypothetical protein